MTLLFPILRHLSAAIAAWLVTTIIGAAGVEVGPDTVASLTSALTTLGALLMIALYAVAEKALKPLFSKMGEETPLATRRDGSFRHPRGLR